VAPDQLALAQIRHHLDGLQRTPDGSVLHGMIERALKKYGTRGEELEETFYTFLQALLARYVRDPEGNPATRFKARILLQHLTPLVSSPRAQSPRSPHAAAPAAAPAEPVAPQVQAQDGDSAPKLEAIQQRLAGAVTETLAGNEAIEKMLESALGASAAGDHADLRDVFATGLHDLLENQRVLRENLRGTQAFLEEMVAERRALRAALGKARRDHPIDESTGLLRRAFFLKQVDAETGRARRYGFALALGLFRIENLEEFGDQHGLKAVEQALARLSEALRTHFRGYDLLARLGDGEFGVLLPNTPEDGAVHAARKLLRGVARIRLANGAASIALPPLRCAVAVYAAPETATAFLQRARRTLDQDRDKRKRESESLARLNV